MDEQRKWFPEVESMESTAVGDALKITEMTIEDLDYYINVVDKAAAGFECIDSQFWKKFCG